MPSHMSREGWPAGGRVTEAAASLGCFSNFPLVIAFGYEGLRLLFWLPLLVLSLHLLPVSAQGVPMAASSLGICSEEEVFCAGGSDPFS